MNTSIKSTHTMKRDLLIKTLFACLIVAAFSFVAIPTRAGDAEENARKAVDVWEKSPGLARSEVSGNTYDNSFGLPFAAPSPFPMNGIDTIEQLKDKSEEDLKDTLEQLRANKVHDYNLKCSSQDYCRDKIALIKAKLTDLGMSFHNSPFDLLGKESCPPVTASLESGNGLQTVTFATLQGRILVKLPDDIRAGDTISGTVVAEPKGNTISERAKYSDSVEGLVVVVGNQRVPVSARQSFVVTFPGMTPSGAVITPDPKITRPTHPSGAIVTPDPKITTPPNTTPPGGRVVPGQANSPDLPMSFFDVFIEPSGASGTGGNARARIPLGAPATHPSGAIITPDPKITQPTHPSGAIITPDPKITSPTPPQGQIITIPGATFGTTPMDRDIVPGFDIPRLGQTGRPIVITGPFDGNFDNTKLTVGDQTMTPLAESPRQVVVQSPSNVTGPAEITVKEGNKETKGTFRNVGVDLTAPKTSLLKGESTTLKIEVSGLQGITEPVPLHLTKGGVVTMQGGDMQTMSIKPSEVQTNGTFTTTRTITGVQTGAWIATATVVVFDVCLQDDNNGSLLRFSSETGDYIFCQGFSNAQTIQSQIAADAEKSSSAAKPITLSTMDIGGGGVATIITPDMRKITKDGSFTVADFNYAGGHIHWQVDDHMHTGSAIVQTTKPKQTFTITDRDTRNNTCACK